MYRWLSFIFPRISVKIFAGTMAVITVVTLYSLVPMSLPVVLNYHLRMAGGYLTGILLYLLIFLLVADLLIFIAKRVKPIPAENLTKRRFYAGTVAILFAALVAGYGLYSARQIRITTFELALQRDIGGEMTIVLISDLHLGEVHSEKRLDRMVSYINSLNPDIVGIAGDIFNDNFYAIRDPNKAAAIFREINATFGVFACLGNHDSGRTHESMVNFLEKSNIRLLNDEHVIIDNRMVLIGRLNSPLPRLADGGFSGMLRVDFAYIMEAVRADLLYHGLPSYLPVVVMDHNPTHINEYSSDVDLALFGHTHAGGHFPFNLATSLMYVLDRGHFQRDNSSPHIIVTQGIHMWSTPVRVGTHNEIVKIIAR